jgi:prevent-host-death family protein
MKQVNIHEAKTHLSSLVEEAAAGEPFIIAKSGRPLAVVHPYTPTPPRQRTGFLKGRVSVPADFDSMGSREIADMFEGAS